MTERIDGRPLAARALARQLVPPDQDPPVLHRRGGIGRQTLLIVTGRIAVAPRQGP